MQTKSSIHTPWDTVLHQNYHQPQGRCWRYGRRALPTYSLRLSILWEAQESLNCVLVSTPPIIKGHFSTKASVTGNFVYTIQGHFSPKEIQGFEESLCKPLPWPVHSNSCGWMDVHTPTFCTHERWPQQHMVSQQLEENTCFQEICLTVPPGWLHNSFVTGLMEHTTVTFAYIDSEDNAVTKKASKAKISMFREFVPSSLCVIKQFPNSAHIAGNWDTSHNFVCLLLNSASYVEATMMELHTTSTT